MRKSESVERYCPRIEEHRLDIEEEERERVAEVADMVLHVARSNRIDAALIRLLLLRRRLPRLQYARGRENHEGKRNRHDEKESKSAEFSHRNSPFY